MLKRQVIYRIRSITEEQVLPYAVVYSDGDCASLCDIPTVARMEEKIWKQRLETARESPNWHILTCSSYRNEKHDKAFVTLCIVTNTNPPFEGYEVEYFGEGEPWINTWDGTLD